MSESRVRENRMHGSIGGCWGGGDQGEPEHAPGRKTGGTEPGRPTAASRTSGLPYRRDGLRVGHFGLPQAGRAAAMLPALGNAVTDAVFGLS